MTNGSLITQKKLIATAIASGLLLSLITIGVLNDYFINTDFRVEKSLNGAQRSGFELLLLVITYFGSIQFVLLACVFLSVIAVFYKELGYFLLFFGTIIAESSFVLLIKDLVERVRPTAFPSVYAETGYSFPSGHTAISVVFYGLAAYILARHAKTRTARTNLLFGWIFFMIMIGFSRLYLGVHYVSDVLGGYAAGFLWLALGLIFFETLFEESIRHKMRRFFLRFRK